MTAPEILNREFLEIRCKILDLAAAFDRLTRADGTVDNDPRLVRLHEAVNSLLAQSESRAEHVQMIFSRPYDEHWQESLNVKPR